MKSIKYILSMTFALSAIAIFTSCGEDEPKYMPAEQESGKAHIVFSGNESQTIEVEPGISSFQLSLERPNAENAASVSLSVKNNEDNVFVVPASVEFASGETTADFTVGLSNPEEGKYYNLTLCLDGELSDYTSGYREKQVSFAIMKWESLGIGYWQSNGIATIFSADVMTMAVEVETAVTSTSVRFRFDNPYDEIATDMGYIGDSDYKWYKGYPFNEEGDFQTLDNKFLIICDTKGQASFTPANMGMDWGYGMFSMGSVDGKYGKYNEAAGTISFAGDALFTQMANWGSVKNGGTLYLGDEAFLNNQTKEIDYENDFTWNTVTEALGTFKSAAQDGNWTQELQTAEENPQLFRFPSLYAEGMNIVFYCDEDGLITMPKKQKTGLKGLGNLDVYVDLVSGSINEDKVYTFKLNFYTVDKDGNKVGEMGTMTEEFVWGMKPQE